MPVCIIVVFWIMFGSRRLLGNQKQQFYCNFFFSFASLNTVCLGWDLLVDKISNSRAINQTAYLGLDISFVYDT